MHPKLFRKTGRKIIALNVHIDHVHLLVKVPQKISISVFVDKIKGWTALFVDAVGLDSDMVKNT